MSTFADYKDLDGNRLKSSLTINILAVILILSNLLQIIVGISTLILIGKYETNLRIYLHSTHQKQLNLELFYLYIFGFHLIIAYCYGLCLSKKCVNECHSPHLGYLLSIWNIYNFLLLIYASIMTWALSRAIYSIISTTEIFMLQGIDNYYTDPEWRLVWDTMQFYQQCCGVESYKDWERTSIQNTVGSSILSLIPYSCCTTDENCYRASKMLGVSRDQAWPKKIDGVSAVGCLKLFSDELHETILCVLIILFTSFSLECLILTIMRFVWRKTKNNDYRNDDCSSLSEYEETEPMQKEITCKRSSWCPKMQNVYSECLETENENSYCDSPRLIH